MCRYDHKHSDEDQEMLENKYESDIREPVTRHFKPAAVPREMPERRRLGVTATKMVRTEWWKSANQPTQDPVLGYHKHRYTRRRQGRHAEEEQVLGEEISPAEAPPELSGRRRTTSGSSLSSSSYRPLPPIGHAPQVCVEEIEMENIENTVPEEGVDM